MQGLGKPLRTGDVNPVFSLSKSTCAPSLKETMVSKAHCRAPMCWIYLCALTVFLCVPCARIQAQMQASALPAAPDPKTADPDPGSGVNEENVSWKKMPGRILHDQKDIWLFPTQLARGRYWVPTSLVVGGTAILIVADPHVAPYFRDHASNLDDLTDSVNGTITSAATAAVPVALLIGGYVRHKPYDINSSLLAGEAYLDGAIVDAVMKGITRRKRPSEIGPNESFHDTFFDPQKNFFSGSSFPSGHSVGAFAVATVIAHRYRQHRWVPWAMYGLATAISLSRVPVRAHFPSDVFLGAALGYSIARFEVLRH
jgi:membrane-associated phospholipid phosphatase